MFEAVVWNLDAGTYGQYILELLRLKSNNWRQGEDHSTWKARTSFSQSPVHKKIPKNCHWWIIFRPVALGACQRLLFAFDSSSDWLIIHSVYGERAPDGIRWFAWGPAKGNRKDKTEKKNRNDELQVVHISAQRLNANSFLGFSISKYKNLQEIYLNAFNCPPVKPVYEPLGQFYYSSFSGQIFGNISISFKWSGFIISNPVTL